MSRWTLELDRGVGVYAVWGYRIVDAPFVPSVTGRYLALLNPEKETAVLQFVGPIPEPEPIEDDDVCPTCGQPWPEELA
jgi:hypothetical protein